MASAIPASLSTCSDQSECEFEECFQESGPCQIPDGEQLLKPAHRGTFRCPCLGEVVMMFGQYGWLATEECIDHLAASKNGGRIYVQSCDIVNGLTLVEGDKVSFFLYVDAWGLGAEGVHLQRWAGSTPSQTHPEPQEFPGMNAQAAEFVPGKNPLAVAFPAFVNNPRITSAMAAHSFGAAPVTMAVNLDDWSDQSDSDEDEVLSIESDRGCDGDVEDFCVMKVAAERKGAKAASRRFLRKPLVRSQGSSSTSAGSDSDIQETAADASLAGSPVSMSPPPGLHPGGRAPTPPPGLRHPGFRPPPGLSLA